MVADRKKINGTLFLCLVSFFLLLTGCADPGRFGGVNYKQCSIDPTVPVSSVTVLNLSPDAENEMMNKEGVVLIGRSEFKTDSDDAEDFSVLKDQAKAQAKEVGANVVLLSRINEGKEDKVRTERVESESQKVIDDVFGNSYIGGSEYKSKSETKTTYNDDNTETRKSEGKSLGIGAEASIADLTALIPGQVKEEKVKYKVDVYKYRAVFLRNPDYKGL